MLPAACAALAARRVVTRACWPGALPWRSCFRLRACRLVWRRMENAATSHGNQRAWNGGWWRPHTTMPLSHTALTGSVPPGVLRAHGACLSSSHGNSDNIA